jgi:hypothetical protein
MHKRSGAWCGKSARYVLWEPVAGGRDSGRRVLVDVKRCDTDFVKHIENIDRYNKEEHDHYKLFRSLESKFIERDSKELLQGVWVVTSIKEDRNLLFKAFSKLNPKKIHFVILGDWQSDAFILAKNDFDKQCVLELFRLQESDRFFVN